MGVQRKLMLPLILVFIFTNTLLIVFKGRLEAWGINREMLLGANCLFFLLNVFVFWLQRNALNNSNPNVFIRSVMGSMFIKMMVVVVVFFIYISIVKKTVNKPAVFAAMFLYLVYLAAEVAALTKLNKQKNG
jgi:hypothetical protein